MHIMFLTHSLIIGLDRTSHRLRVITRTSFRSRRDISLERKKTSAASGTSTSSSEAIDVTLALRPNSGVYVFVIVSSFANDPPAKSS